MLSSFGVDDEDIGGSICCGGGVVGGCSGGNVWSGLGWKGVTGEREGELCVSV